MRCSILLFRHHFYIALIIFPILSLAQKEYKFDYLIEYNFQLNEKAKCEKVFFYTNSKDNSYTLRISQKDSLDYKLDFHDENGYGATVFVPIRDLFKASSITVSDCKLIHKYSNPFKYQVDNYSFKVLTDTILNSKSCNRYMLKSNDSKREKKKKLGTEVYCIEPNTDFHLPILVFCTAFEEWKKEKGIPNGIFSKYYFVSIKNKISLMYTLVDYKKVNAVLKIPKPCTGN